MALKVLRDVRGMFGPARDQGARPTCLAFAASDFHAALRPGWIPLSCEFAFYHAQRRGGRSPHVGATLRTILEVLREDGQPAETDWPYLHAVPRDLDAWAPPDEIVSTYRRAGEHRGHDIDEVIALLDSDCPALLLMTLSDSFYSPNPAGIVVASGSEGPDPTRRHAVVAVAHGILAGERAILVRNSWGQHWGNDGHAWLLESFLAPRLFRVALLTENIDVLADRAAA